MSVTVYRFFDKDDRLLYVGVTAKPGRRLGHHEKHKQWWTTVVRTTMEHYDTRSEALNVEREAIENETPLFNVIYNRPPKPQLPSKPDLLCKSPGRPKSDDPRQAYTIRLSKTAHAFWGQQGALAERSERAELEHYLERTAAKGAK